MESAVIFQMIQRIYLGSWHVRYAAQTYKKKRRNGSNNNRGMEIVTVNLIDIYPSYLIQGKQKLFYDLNQRIGWIVSGNACQII